MIVRCKKCGTKYRFDESIIDGDGGWVRCSRCSEVFFLENPATDGISVPPDTSASPGAARTGAQVPVGNDLKQDLLQAPGMFADGRKKEPVPVVLEGLGKYRAEERDMEPEIKAVEKNLGEFDGDLLDDKDPERYKPEEKNKGRDPKVKARPARSRTKQWVLVASILMVGVIYLWFFFEIGNQVANLTSSAVSTLMERIQGVNTKSEDGGLAQVQLTDLRQRFVTNLSLGNIRVIEGIAVNQSSHPMTRIKIRGELVGAGGVLLGEMTSYCGNLITDEELIGMTEEQILKELSNPLGSDVSNDQISAKGQIPFLLVFTHEPPGVMKTYVVPAQAERLLP